MLTTLIRSEEYTIQKMNTSIVTNSFYPLYDAKSAFFRSLIFFEICNDFFFFKACLKNISMSRSSELSEFRVSDPSVPVRILRNPNDRTASVEPITVPALMKRTVENYGDCKALMYKDDISKNWRGITYKEYRDRVEKMAKVFIKLGLQRHGTVAVLAFNSVEWFISELAAIHAG